MNKLPRLPFRRRVGFWRALGEMLLLGNTIVLLLLPFGNTIISPWSELLSYVALGVYPLAAWRLMPGQGSLPLRLLRVAAWLVCFGLLNGLIAWLVLIVSPWKHSFLGMRMDDVQLGLGAYLISALFLAASLVLPTRMLLASWALGRSRLRWRLTFSYMLIGVLTVFFVPLALLLYVAVVSLFTVPTIFPPRDLAPRLAAAIGPTVRAGASPGQLDSLLAGLLDGTTRLPMAAQADPAALVAVEDEVNLPAGGVRRLSLLRPDGVVLGSAGRTPFPTGVPLSAENANQLQLLIDSALTGSSCVEGRPTSGPLADTVVCPIADASGLPLALLALESKLDSSAQVGAAFGRIIAVTLIGVSLTLNLTLFVVVAILPVGLGVGYLLARGLTRRIERLAAATADIAAGNLDRQLQIDDHDEIGLLGADFNAMTNRLSEREHALEATAARAEALLQTNRRLVADVSHELRNPLATLRGYLEALEHEHGEKLPTRDMQVIQSEMQRLTGLVDDLFTLARAEAKQLPLKIGLVAPGPLLQGLADTLAPLARREREIELVAQVDANLGAIRADQTRIEQVIRNLVQNALRHTPSGGIIVLAASAVDEQMIGLSVADTGVGIEPEDLPHVFERFYRGDSSRTRETGGAGLGLALVRELVTAMDGSVEVESTPGRGSRFTVRLPRAE